MKGRLVNFLMALLNLIVGSTVLVYALKIPKDMTELTVQEYQIINITKIVLYSVLGVITFLNIINYFLNSRNGLRKTGYLFAIFSISFIFIKEWSISIFGFLSAFIIFVATVKERWVEANSITAISIIGILVVLLAGTIGICFIYNNLGAYILKKENENELSYKSTYFEYITELDVTEPYLNVKKDGLYGYITTSGNLAIDYQFEYASPFVQITAYDKSFQVALVCKDGRSLVIMKNGREVLTYRSESMDGDYEAKEKELEDIYYNTLGQTEPMRYEIEGEVSNINKVPAYDTQEAENVYRYDYNEEYDIVITTSELGVSDKYQMVKKDTGIAYDLDCEKLCYDENYLYLFSNGNIPYYDLSVNKQGWFTKYGNKIKLKGNAQILEIVNDYILIKNHNNDTIYFINSEGTKVSDTYKEIFIYNADRYIVKNDKNKYMVINSNFEKVFDSEWDFVDTSLLPAGVYVFGTISGVIEFNDYDYSTNMNLSILDENGNVLAENIQQVYNKQYTISDDEEVAYAQRYSDFLNNLKVLNYTFVGDEFYN